MYVRVHKQHEHTVNASTCTYRIAIWTCQQLYSTVKVTGLVVSVGNGHVQLSKIWSDILRDFVLWVPSVLAASIREELLCQKEKGNAHDAFAVAVEKESRIIGHVPRNKLSTCSLLLELTQYQLAHAHYSDIGHRSQTTEIWLTRPVLSTKISRAYIFMSCADSPKRAADTKVGDTHTTVIGVAVMNDWVVIGVQIGSCTRMCLQGWGTWQAYVGTCSYMYTQTIKVFPACSTNGSGMYIEQTDAVF